MEKAESAIGESSWSSGWGQEKDPEVKEEAVAAYLAGEGTLEQVAQRFDMSRSLLHRIVHRYSVDDKHLQRELHAVVTVVALLRKFDAAARQRIIDYTVAHLEGDS